MRIALGLLGTIMGLSPMLSAFGMIESVGSGAPAGSFPLPSLPLVESASRSSQSDNDSLTHEAAASTGTTAIISSTFRVLLAVIGATGILFA